MFLSLEQIAERLALNVRTVRGYVRTGRLKAARIGKQYRVASEDLDAFIGRTSSAHGERGGRIRRVEVSSIVEVDAISPDLVARVSSRVLGAAQSRQDGDGALRVETIYDPDRARLKVIVVGSLPATANIFKLVLMSLEA
ncbi:MAG: helix-turn-helix domain-containing protein [Steroidobacteraceae bacterium]|jgi:excisionase family DNA binding protein